MKSIAYTLAVFLGVAIASPVELSARANPAYMATVDKWRKAANLPPFIYAANLEANAKKAATDGKGSGKIELLGGSSAEITGAGNDFATVYLTWLCEVPESYLSGQCKTVAPVGTGHHAVLVSTKYTKIGCGNASGWWYCDVA